MRRVCPLVYNLGNRVDAVLRQRTGEGEQEYGGGYGDMMILFRRIVCSSTRETFG